MTMYDHNVLAQTFTRRHFRFGGILGQRGKSIILLEDIWLEEEIWLIGNWVITIYDHNALVQKLTRRHFHFGGILAKRGKKVLLEDIWLKEEIW